MGQFSPVHWAIAALTIAPLIVLMVVPVWRILQRAGYSGAWALLMLVPLVGFVVLWVLAFVKWPSDKEGATRTSVPWIIAGILLLPLSIGSVALLSSTGVRQVATVEQKGVPSNTDTQTVPPSIKPKYLTDEEVGLNPPSQQQPATLGSTDRDGKPCGQITEFLGECKR